MPFDDKELLDLFIVASKRMSENSDRCRNLIYTQNRIDKNIIREPEVTYVIAQLLSEKNIQFGLEVPTNKEYFISSTNSDYANTDLAINPKDKQINIEFKVDQPNPKEIKKDIAKLLREEVFGTAFFHILKNYNIKTLPKLLYKFEVAFKELRHIDKSKKWFLFFIYVKEKNEYFWQFFEDIRNISDFNVKGPNKV